MSQQITYSRPHLQVIASRLTEPSRTLIQILRGPRQVGKTTLLGQLFQHFSPRSIYASADLASPDPEGWLENLWQRARALSDSGPAFLLIDEVQTLPDWSHFVKRLCDDDAFHGRNVRVVLSGSSALLLQKGLTESLAGRFEMHAAEHWDFAETREAFGYDLASYLAYGGYPGLSHLLEEPQRLEMFCTESLIEPAIGRDILALQSVQKPALLRQVFSLIRHHTGEILSFNKMLGQLQDSGNGTTIAHYVRLLEIGGLVRILDRYAGNEVRRKAAIPKLMVSDTGLAAVPSGPLTRMEYLALHPEMAGRILETAVGNHLIRAGARNGWQLFYWRDGAHEVDFVAVWGDRLTAIEVKGGQHPGRGKGLAEFRSRNPHAKTLIVGPEGIPGVHITSNEFLSSDPGKWLQ
jgi:predicted AAA+ superfamily ATPase